MNQGTQILLYLLAFLLGVGAFAIVLRLYRKRLPDREKQQRAPEDRQTADPTNAKAEDLRKDLKLRLDNQEIVNALGQVVTSSLALEQIFQRIYKTINSMMDAAVMELSIYEPSTQSHRILTNNGTVDEGYRNHVAEWVLENKKEILLDDLEDQFGRYVYAPLVTSDGKMAKACMVFPIESNGKDLGTLSVFSYRPAAFDKYHADMIRSLLPYTAVAISNAAIHQEIINIQQQLVHEKKEVENQREEAIRQYNRSEELLLNILPEEIADELKTKGSSEARLHNQVTVLFTDFHNFTRATEQLTAHELVHEIHHSYSKFDEITSKYGLEKIKTIGDSYMCASGLPVYSEDHAIKAVNAALELMKFIKQNKQEKERQGKPFFELRIGINSGPVIAGIVGVKKFQYDIWGDTVNTASRMESQGEVGEINISETTYLLVKDHFKCRYRGKIEAKHKGKLDMYFVEGPING